MKGPLPGAAYPIVPSSPTEEESGLPRDDVEEPTLNLAMPKSPT